ncbi:translocase of chloroplast 159, chloroplastic, partial [Sesamum indicum]|uniref:Translocase of chloroplast 159, chloroplastic n=1 Tax=Sesamum indicum TaxID=4182 RepID=A0A8M8V291_SESIN
SGSLSIGDEVDEAKVIEQPEAALVEQEVLEVGNKDDEKLTPEGYSVIESIQVDVAGPGVAVVGETEENEVVPNKPEEEVADVAAIEPEKSEVVSLVDVAPMPEGDSVVDTIQVDAPNPELAVEEAEQNGVAANELEANEAAEEVGLGDVKLTPAGDSVVDTIQVGMVGPGVAVVGETQENGGKIEGVEVPLQLVGGSTESGNGVNEEVSTREVGADNPSFEPAAESSKDVLESKTLEPEHYVVGDENGEKSDAGTVVDLVNGVHKSLKSNDSIENGTTDKIHTDGEVGLVDETVAADRDVNQLYASDAGTVQTNGVHGGVPAQNDGLADRMDEEVHPEDSMSDEDTDGMIFGSSEAAKKFIEDLERESGGDSHTGADSSFEQSQRLDGQIVTDSEEEGDTDEEGDGKELFDSAALAALLKAATGADSDGGSITITSQDGSRLFSVERPAGLGSSLRSLRPAPRPTHPNLFSPASAGGGESEDNLSEEEKKKLEKLQQIRVKFLRLVHRLGLSPEESVAAQVLYRLALLGGRQGIQTFSLDAAKRMALQLEAGESDDLDFSVDILVLGKSGVGKSATINSIFGEEKAPIDPFETGTASAKEISGLVDGVKVRIVDTPGLKSSVMEQGFNRSVLSSVKKFTKKSSPDVVLYVDRLDAQSRDLNDLPLLKTVTSSLGSSIWRSAIVTLTHAASAPPDGPSGSPLCYEVFVSQRSHVVQQSIGHAVGDLRMMSPSLMNPVSLVENHPSCRKNREGQKILPNGQSWRPQLLLLCYSMKILSEASSLSKPQDPFDHRKLFGFRARAPPLPYMLSSMLQSRAHPKLPSDQGGENVDSDIDLDDLSDSDQEEEDEYDQLPPFKPLKKAQLAKLSREQRKAYLEEYDYRVKLLQKKQWREELRRMREIKKKGKDVATDYGFTEDDADSGAAAPVAVPLPDMALPPSFDGDNPAYRYRFLEPTSQFLARPVLDSHGWDHDCGYDGVNLEHSLAIANRFPLAYTVQITKDKKDFTISLDSSISAKHGENMSSMAGFDIQSMGKQLAYIVRAETKLKNLKKNRAAGGLSFTFLGENVVPGVKIEDEITLGKQYVLVGSAGAVRSQHDTAYGANFELQRRELDYPIGQVQSTLSMSVIKWRGDLALGFNSLAQFSIGRNSKVAVRAGINNKLSGQVTVRTSSSEHLSLALAAIIPTALSIYKKLFPTAGEKYSIY